MKQFLINNNFAIFFIGFFLSLLDDIISIKYFSTVIGGILMLLSFYLMNLKSKQS
jgi:hypothetical protein